MYSTPPLCRSCPNGLCEPTESAQRYALARRRARLERMAEELRAEGYHVERHGEVCPHCAAKEEPHPSRDHGERCSWCGRPALDPIHDPRRAWSRDEAIPQRWGWERQ